MPLMTLKNNFTMTAAQASNSGNHVRFIPFSATVDATEADATVTLNFGFVIREIIATIGNNNKNADSIFGFRDDGSTIESVTIGAGLTGEFSTGIISTAVQTGSVCSIIKDTTASASGNMGYTITTWCNN